MTIKETLQKNLRAHAAALGLSNAEVARRAGLTERQYLHYLTTKREPNLQSLVKIATVLQTTPDQLLGFDSSAIDESDRDVLLRRLTAAAKTLGEAELELMAIQIEAVAASRRRPRKRHKAGT